MKTKKTPELDPTMPAEPALELAAPEPSTPEQPAPEQPKGGKKKRAAPPPVATLELASEGYLGWMESQGKSRGTIASYSAELKLAMSELGAETLLAALTPEQVATYFASPRVTRLRSGKPKSQLSIDKTRRVLRLALGWAVSAGWIESVPLPTGGPQAEPPAKPARRTRSKDITVVVGDDVVLDGSIPEDAA